MELETENTTNSIKIPLSASDEYIQLFVDELEDDPTSLISLLFDEYVPPKYWIQIAIGYYSLKKYDQFLQIIDTILKDENYDKFRNEYENKLVLMNYRIAYKLKSGTLTSEEYKKYDLDSNPLINWEGQDRNASATALALKCIYCLRSDDLKNALTFMRHALDRDRTCLLSSIAAALYYIQIRNFKNAINAYQMALISHPDCPASVRVGIAYCFYQMGNYKKAFKALDRALQLDPACEEALAMKASLLRTAPDLTPQERIVASLQTVKQLYSVNPKHSVALNYIADHHFWTWIPVPNITARVQKGSDRVFVSGDCSRFVRPAHPLRINGVMCYVKASRDAVEEHMIVLSRPYLGEDVENVELQIRDTAKSLEYTLDSIKHANMSTVRSEAFELAGRCYHVNGNWTKAREMYEKALRANKRNILAQYEMAQISIHFSSLGRTKKEKEDLRNQARSYLSSCTQYGGTSHEITFLAAYLQFKSNDLIKALGTVASLPDVGDQMSPRTFLNTQLLKAQLLQGSFRNTNELQKARVLYESCVKLAAGTPLATSPQIWNNIAVLRLALHAKSDALVAIDEALQLSCRDLHMNLENRSILDLTSGELRTMMHEPSNVTMLYNYAVMLDEEGQEENAKKIWETIVNEIPQYYECELRLVKQIIRHKHIREAISRMKCLCSDLESQLNAGFLKESQTLLTYVTNCYADCLCLLAQTLAQNKNPQEAITLITRSYLSRSRQHDLYLNLVLSNIYFQISRDTDPRNFFRNASEMVQRALRRNPNNIFLANGCGVILQRTGKLQAALQVFKKVRESALTYASCCVNLAHMFMMDERYHDAASLYQTALQSEACQRDINVYMCLGLALIRSGNDREAVEVLMRAQKKDPTNEQVRYDLALARSYLAENLYMKVGPCHLEAFNKETNCYPCCGGNKDHKGCQICSKRAYGEVAEAESSLQKALNVFEEMKTQNDGSVPSDDIEKHLARCTDLWSRREYHRELDKDILNPEEMALQAEANRQKELEKQRLKQLQMEQEKREQEQRIDKMVAEEKRRLALSLQAISAMEVRREEGRKTRASKPRGGRAARGRANQVEEDEIVESSSSDTDDNGEMSDEVVSMHRDVFGSESENEDGESKRAKDRNQKKRVRAVESSEDEGDDDSDKRPRIENDKVTDTATDNDLDKEETKSDTKQSEPLDEDTVTKEVEDLFGDEESDSFVCLKTTHKRSTVTYDND